VKQWPSGVPGLDTVLGGGLEPGSVTVLAGAPGVGKTILAQQICFANATPEHRAIYYSTLSEPHSKLVKHLSEFEFFSGDALGATVEYLHLGDFIRHDSANGLDALISEIVRQATEERPSIVVIDSAKALQDFLGEAELRKALYDLTSRLAHSDAALLLLGEYTPEEMQGGIEFSLTDNILHLEYEPREPIDRRWLRVVKMRGKHHLVGKHTFRITSTHGFQVFPRIETIDVGPAADVTGRISTGVTGLDALMGGGIGAGEATVVLGPSGIGKTISGLRFVAEGLAQGERCLYVTFQDTADQLIKMAAAFDWDLRTPRDDGGLVLHHVPLGELDLDILAAHIRAEVAGGRVQRVVIDSLAEMVFACRESERFPAYARSLIGLVRTAGASLVVTSETTTLGPTPEPVGGIIFLFHNVILLRYIELGAEMGRAVNIVKMRNSDHSKEMHRFLIDAGGMAVGDRLDQVSGALGWSALRSPGDLSVESAYPVSATEGSPSGRAGHRTR
jgi:circadian clock protein KaiC